MIGVDLAKAVFQLHAATLTGEVRFRKKLSRAGFVKFMAEQPPAVVVMEACGSAHYCAREMTRLGHEVKLIAAQYVKPFVKRQKNDAADSMSCSRAISSASCPGSGKRSGVQSGVMPWYNIDTVISVDLAKLRLPPQRISRLWFRYGTVSRDPFNDLVSSNY